MLREAIITHEPSERLNLVHLDSTGTLDEFGRAIPCSEACACEKKSHYRTFITPRSTIVPSPVIHVLMDEDIKKRLFAKELAPRFRYQYDAYPKGTDPCEGCEEEIKTDRSFGLLGTSQLLLLDRMHTVSFAV